MLVNTAEIEDKVIDALKNDPTLASYVKSFSRGGMNISKKQFPFVEVGNFSYREEQLLAASGIFVYSVDIYAGTKNLAQGVAYQGSESGTKGITGLCHDIVKVILNNHFSGAFFNIVANINNIPRYRGDKSETICIGKVSFTGDVWFRHS
ncbi:MAG TPA: hypothetical protein PLN69_11350 [bacterium]|nr:hypothetical protein [bacterium]